MKGHPTLIASLVLLAACCALVGVSYFGWTVASEANDHAALLASAQQAATARETAARTHALVTDTTQEQGALTSFLSPDIVSVATLITQAGNAAGVQLQLSNALPEGKLTGQPAGSPPVYAVGFVVEGTGSFAALMRAEALLESLPLPSSIDRFDIQSAASASGASSGTWHMSASIRVLTTVNVSS